MVIEAQKQKMMDGRIKKLEKEINKFNNNIQQKQDKIKAL